MKTRLFPSPNLDPNSSYYGDDYYGDDLKPAVFSHAYNPSGSMLFTGGGGEWSAFNASYAALWDTSSGLQVQAARYADGIYEKWNI